MTLKLKKSAIALTLVLIMLTCSACLGGKSGNGEQFSFGGTVKVSAGTKVTGDSLELPEESGVMPDVISRNMGILAWRLLREAAAESSGTQSLMISPESVLFSLSMATMGAEGETFKQLTDLLCPGATKADLNSYAAKLISDINKGGVLKSANAIWINDDLLKKTAITVSEKYLNLMRSTYGANALAVPFTAATVEDVNGWINKQTDGMIDNVLDKFTEDTFMLLVNAMAFDAKWKEPYKKTQIIDSFLFTNSAKQPEFGKMLSSSEKYYMKECGATGFMKKYEGDKYAFLAMLPDDKDISLSEFLNGLDDEALTRFYQSRISSQVNVIIPCFKFDCETPMTDILKNLGVTVPFDEDKAQFLDILEEGTYPETTYVWIERVLHKTHIELDENGTKAAATTISQLGMKATSAEPEEIKKVILDRPFVFAIMDVDTEVPVFMGVVNSIK